MFEISPQSETFFSLRLPAISSIFVDKKGYTEHALKAVAMISRSFNGEGNTDSSPNKPELICRGDDLKQIANINVGKVLEILFSYPNIILDNPSKVAQLVAVVSLTLNQGLVDKRRGFWRTWETNFGWEPVDSLKSGFRQKFCAEFSARFCDSKQDPISFAFWIEKCCNTQLHPFTDGCGRTSMTLSAWVLGRAGLFSAKFASREEYFDLLTSSYENGLSLYTRAVKAQNPNKY